MLGKEEIVQSAKEFLDRHETGNIATVSPADFPATSTVYFAYAPDFTIYFVCSRHSTKFKNLTQNNNVCFSVGAGPEYQELTIMGNATLLDGKQDHEFWFAAISSRVKTAPSSWPVHVVKSLADGGSALVRVTPKSVTYLNLTNTDQLHTLDKYFYQIYP